MNKKMFLCVTLLTHINTYTMLFTRMFTARTQQHKRMFTNNTKNFYGNNSIVRYLNSCKPEIALERVVAIVFSPLQSTQEEKTTYINSMLCRTDLSHEQCKTLTLLKAFLNQQKSHPFHDQNQIVMHTAIQENNQLLLQASLEHNLKSSVDLPDKAGDSALYSAATQGRLHLVQILLYHCANPNIQNDKGHTPLHGAVTSPLINTTPENNDALVKIMHHIKNAGANLTIKDNQKKRPIDYIHTSLEKFENYRSRTLHNEHGELLALYHEMEKILRTPSKNE
jgi:hypothetical protein